MMLFDEKTYPYSRRTIFDPSYYKVHIHLIRGISNTEGQPATCACLQLEGQILKVTARTDGKLIVGKDVRYPASCAGVIWISDRYIEKLLIT